MKSRFKNSFLIVLIIALSLWLSAFTIKGNTDTSLPSHGYRLIIDNDGGKVFDDGIEVQSGYIKELREAEQEGKLLACPDDGFVVQTWYLIRLDNDKFTELGKQNLCQFGVYSGFVEIHVSFEQKECYKLHCSRLCGDQDVTLEKDYESLIGNIPGESWTSYKVDSDVNPDAILENFYSVTQPSGITQLFQQGLNYYTVDPADDSWLVLTQPIYPSYNYQLNCPVLLGDGFSVSDENMVVLSRTIRNTDGDAFNCIILKLTGDIHISFIMHEIEYTMLEIECNDNEGEVLVDPEKNLDPNFWFEGTLVTLQARPKQGFKFVKWECSSGDVITDVNNMFNPISFTLGSEPVSMIPVFEPATACERSVLTSVNPQEKAVIYVNGSDSVVSVLEGSVVNLSLSVNEYYLFDHWEVYQNGVEELNNLVTPAMQIMEKSSFLMPFGEQGVTVVAVLKDRYETINAVAMFGTMYGGSFDDLVTVSYHVNSGGELFNNSLSANIQKGDIVTVDSILLNNDNYSFDCLKIVKITEKGEEIVLNTNEVPVEFCLDEWLSYRICCVLSLNSGSQSQGKPLLSDGVAKRTGENTAIVSFTSDTEGRYYYGICDPPYRIFVSTNSDQNGYYAAAGVNVINIDSLSSGAKVICILLKTSEGVLSDLYAIDIPAYKDEHVENELYSVNINVPPGGNVFCDKHTAKAGEVVYISVVPDDGYRLVEGSLVYTQSISGIESTVIFGYSFAMPHCDVVVSCQWEKIAEYQPDSASQYWDDIVNVSNQKPWWIYANELANKGDYPKYW